MRKQDFDIFEVAIVLVIVGILASTFLGPYYFCPARWAQSGLSAEFHFGVGCMVKRKDGTLVPEKAIRDVNL